jgi:hypothetical protein
VVKLADATNSLTVARELAAQGLQVFPARYKDKPPLVDWKKYQKTSATPMLEKWFKNKGYLNYWVLTGRQSGYIVIDCDSVDGDKWWRSILGDEVMDNTAQVNTAKGTHYWFKIPEECDLATIKSWSIHPRDEDGHKVSFDVRADGTGVIVPPSVHESGLRYTWTRPLEDALPCPATVWDGTAKSNAPAATGDATGERTGTGGQSRSILSRLLSRPPGGEGSGRNDWLARVAGHYAKTYHHQEDLFRTHCEQANAAMGTPLDETEFEKTIASIWKGEHENNVYRDMDASTGYLASGGNRMMCQVVQKKGEDKVDYDIVEYADFDLHAKGVMVDDAGSRTYWCEVARKKRDGSGETERFDIVIRAEVLGDDRAFRRFLARFACTIVPPENMWPRAGSPGVRVQRYLESQRPPTVDIVPCLGWNDDVLGTGSGGFVTHDGAITVDGHVGIESVSVRSDPRLRSGGTAPFEYGFAENPTIASGILREVLTFHDEATATVFGSWWAACLLKPQIEKRTALFPFMAVEAPSESGKTNGYFAMMTQLNGNTRGETQPTKAALRDMAAANRNGIVWIDDLDDPAYLMELLRAATSGGSLTKMGEDRESVKNTQIVAPIVISGEALGLGTQKALVDRAILLKAPSPTARRSLHRKSRPQWDDILDVRQSYPQGLHVLAGWYVQEALNVQDQVLEALRQGRTGGHGRASDKVAVLRAGARLLDWLETHDGTAWDGAGAHAVRLETWLRGGLVDEQGEAISSNENSLTLEILPWALRSWHYQVQPSAGEKPGEPDTPVYIYGADKSEDRLLFGDEVEVRFRCDLLAEAWERSKFGRNEKRTTTSAALSDQATALGCSSKQVKIVSSGGRRASYRVLTGDLAKQVINRSRGK